jgi:hypothetical protein
MQTEELKLPYTEILQADIARRNDIRADEDLVRASMETYWIPIERIEDRPGFNPRQIYVGIEELAEKIAANGLEPMTVDVLRNGKIYVEKGNRRTRALRLLWQSGVAQQLDLPGLRQGKALCFINSYEVTELQRCKNALSSNDQMNLTDLEQAEVIWRMIHLFSVKKEDIHQLTGIRLSRQQIDNRLKLAEQSETVKQFVRDGFAKATVITDLARIVKTPEKVEEVVAGIVGSGRAIKNADIQLLKEQARENREAQTVTASGEDADYRDEFDENRDEIQWCQNVIRLLDKIVNVAGNPDVDKLAGYAQTDMERIRDYVQKHTRR